MRIIIFSPVSTCQSTRIAIVLSLSLVRFEKSTQEEESYLSQYVNVCQCHKFRLSSKNKVRRCENFSVKFKPIFRHLDLVK